MPDGLRSGEHPTGKPMRTYAHIENVKECKNLICLHAHAELSLWLQVADFPSCEFQRGEKEEETDEEATEPNY